MTVIATLSASRGVAGRRHAVLAIGSGLTGLIATKALKFSQVNITDALVFVTRIAVQCTSHFVSQASHWTPFVPAAVEASVLIALAVAAVVDIVELIAAPPSSGWTVRSAETADSYYAATLYGVRRSIAKGWFRS
jgi:hypothetical protein